MTRRRVVITGLGVVSSLGNTIEEFWQACKEGKTHVEPVPEEWSHYYKSKSRIWSPLPLPDYSKYGLNRADLLRYDPAVLNAIVAADQALSHAGISKRVRDERSRTYELEGVDSDRVGVFIGTGFGSVSSAFSNYVPHLLGRRHKFLQERSLGGYEDESQDELLKNLAEHPRVNPFIICKSMTNAIAAQLSIRYRIRGPAETLCYACASGTMAMIRAFVAIRSGEIDLAIVGGSEYFGDRSGGAFMGFDRLGTLVGDCYPNELGNRPFDVARSGFLFAQGGAGALVIESGKRSRRKSAIPIAIIRGSGISSDANSLAAISEDDNAIKLMFERLINDAKLPASEIDYINSHGTSTVQNDPIEAEILQRVFPSNPLINSTKSLLGHTIGASGAIEAIVAALSLRDGVVHPSRNLIDPVRDLNFATSFQHSSIEFVVTHSFGFGGHNAGLVLSHPRS